MDGLSTAFAPAVPGGEISSGQQPLSGALNQLPDLSAPPPQTPEELGQRKSSWRGILDHIQGDPNIMRAIAVAGIRMLQPGASLGQGLASGYGAYELGQQGQQEAERQAAKDAQAAALNQANVEQLQQQAAASRANVESQQQRSRFEAEKQPLDMKKLQAEIDAIPDEVERRRLGLELDKASILATKASAEAARHQAEKQPGMTQAQLDENAFNSFLEEEKLINPTQPEAVQRANALRTLYNSRYGVGTQMRQQSSDQQALDLYNTLPNPTPSDLFNLGESGYQKWLRGKALATRKPTGPNDSGTQPIGAPTAVPAQSAPQAVEFVRDAAGNIVRKK